MDHKSVVAKLNVLLKNKPSPTPKLAAIWANVLAEGVTPADILTYALLRQVKRHMAGSQDVRQEHAVTSVSLRFAFCEHLHTSWRSILTLTTIWALVADRIVTTECRAEAERRTSKANQAP